MLVDLPRQALAVAPREEPPVYVRVDFPFDDDGGAIVNELEFVQPMLFFQHRPEAALGLADATLISSAG